MALTFNIAPGPCRSLSHYPFILTIRFSNISKRSLSSIPPASIYNKNSLKIQSRKGKHKRSLEDKNAQIGGLGFSVLDALKLDKHPKTRTEKSQENDAQSAHRNEERKTSIALLEKRKQNNGTLSPEDSDLEKNDDILPLNSRDISPLNSREKAKPSVSGENILWALQKASVQKANEEGRRRTKKKNANRGDGTRRGYLEMAPRVLGEVRPITVKPEWGARIESLEKRVKELKERTEFA